MKMNKNFNEFKNAHLFVLAPKKFQYKNRKNNFILKEVSVNFYPLTHPILAKTKNQILLFLTNISRRPEKISAKKKFWRKPQYFEI